MVLLCKYPGLQTYLIWKIGYFIQIKVNDIFSIHHVPKSKYIMCILYMKGQPVAICTKIKPCCGFDENLLTMT